VDGDPSDWAGISPILSDPADDIAIRDVREVYITNDRESVYFLTKLTGIPALSGLNRAVTLSIDTDRNLDTPCRVTGPPPYVPIGAEYYLMLQPVTGRGPTALLYGRNDCRAEGNYWLGTAATVGNVIEGSVNIADLRILVPDSTGFDFTVASCLGEEGTVGLCDLIATAGRYLIR
jgi:hypothetical protein